MFDGEVLFQNDTKCVLRFVCNIDDQPKKFPKERNEIDDDWLEMEQLTNAMKSGMNLDRDHWVQMAEYVKHPDLKLRYEGTRNFRMMLSVTGEIPIQAVIETGVVPHLVDSMRVSEVTKEGRSAELATLLDTLRLEASWALTNIASGTAKQTEVVVNAGVVPLLVDLLRSDREDLREQGIWGLGNVAGDRATFRDLVLSQPNAMDCFLEVCRTTEKSALFHTAMWSLSNLCRGKPRPEWRLVSKAVPLLVSVLQSAVGLIQPMFSWPIVQERDVIADICWALDGISEAKTSDADDMRPLNALLPVVPALLRFLSANDDAVQRPVVRLLGQLAAGTTEHTKALLHAGAVPVLLQLLAATNPLPVKAVRKDVCWTLSNVAAGPPEHVRELIATGAINRLLHVVAHDEDLEVRKEAAWAIANTLTTQCATSLFQLLREGSLWCVMDLLDADDLGVAEVAVDSLRNVLNFGLSPEFRKLSPMESEPNVCLSLIKSLDGTTKLLRLHNAAQSAGSFSLWKKSGELLSGLSTWGGI